jgi:hypothetical protein
MKVLNIAQMLGVEIDPHPEYGAQTSTAVLAGALRGTVCWQALPFIDKGSLANEVEFPIHYVELPKWVPRVTIFDEADRKAVETGLAEQGFRLGTFREILLFAHKVVLGYLEETWRDYPYPEPVRVKMSRLEEAGLNSENFSLVSWVPEDVMDIPFHQIEGYKRTLYRPMISLSRGGGDPKSRYMEAVPVSNGRGNARGTVVVPL